MWVSVSRVRTRCVASRLWYLQLPREGRASFRDKVEDQGVKPAVSIETYAVICLFPLEWHKHFKFCF